MFIYKKNDKGTSVDVYQMIPDAKAIYDYRQNQAPHRFYEATAINQTTEDPRYHQKYDFLLNSENKFYTWEELNNKITHKMESDFQWEHSKAETILKNYYNGIYNSKQIMPVIRNNQINGLVFINGTNYITNNNAWGHDASINNILMIQQKLYLLEMLIREKYGFVIGEDIKEQLKLFSLSDKITSFNISDLENFSKTGLVNDSFENLNDKIDASTEIVKQLKRF